MIEAVSGVRMVSALRRECISVAAQTGRRSRLGNDHIMPTRGAGMVESREYQSAGPNGVPATDNWLNAGVAESRPPTQQYLDVRPDVDARPDGLKFAAPEDSGIADAADFKAPSPGPVSKSRGGLFTDIMCGGTKDGYAAASEFLGSIPHREGK
jgi:hypothetical protein